VVVGDDVDLAAFPPEIFDPLDPFAEFIGRVKVIVTVVAPGVFAKPVLVIPAVKTDIGEVGIGADGRRLDGIPEKRLIDVAEADSVFFQNLKKTGDIPGCVPNLKSQGKLGKKLEQVEQVIRVCGRVSIGPGELEKNGGQASLEMKEVDPGLELLHVLPGEILSSMGKDLMELDGKTEIRESLDLLDPGKRHGRTRGPVEGAVDLDDVDIPGEVGEGMEPPFLSGRIDDSLPIGITPACRSVIKGGHALNILGQAGEISNKKKGPAFTAERP
jgi:hypothetical protein